MEKIVLLLIVIQFITTALALVSVLLAAGRMIDRQRKELQVYRHEEPVQGLDPEDEAKKVAAEAQRLYDEGFVNLMQYDGRPRKKGDEE